MTLEELRKYHPNATAETWHRHPNGGGWVENTAMVESSAYVGPNARVSGLAQVCDYARIEGQAWVCGDALVMQRACISDRALICGSAEVYEKARIAGRALIFGSARIYGDAEVTGLVEISGHGWIYTGRWTRRPLQLHGSRDVVCECAPGELAIGSEMHTVAQWRELGRRIGRSAGYTEEQIEEYRLYVELFATLEALRAGKRREE